MLKTQENKAVARVTAVHRERFEVRTDEGVLFARLKQSAYLGAQARDYPTVGDDVTILTNPAGDALIVQTLPRRSHFLRKLPHKTVGEQAVAANFDEVFVLMSMNRDFNVRRVERYVALAWQSGGTPVVVLTKADLAEDVPGCIAQVEAVAPSAPVYAVSAVTGEGLTALRGRLTPGKTIVLLGSSGVGKSSLINALAGDVLMDTGAVRADDDRGRHTTTHRQLLTLPGGIDIIDTPGMRELGLYDAEEGVREAFEDIDMLAARCRFSDCHHETEPGCAVREAIEAGTLDASRLNNYRRLQREAARRKQLEKIKKKK